MIIYTGWIGIAMWRYYCIKTGEPSIKVAISKVIYHFLKCQISDEDKGKRLRDYLLLVLLSFFLILQLLHLLGASYPFSSKNCCSPSVKIKSLWQSMHFIFLSPILYHAPNEERFYKRNFSKYYFLDIFEEWQAGHST
jgi:hypothetical protein